MVTYTRPEIDWDTFPGSDGEPMAETVENAIQMVDLQFALRCLLETQGRVRVAVGGNQLMYYNQRNGRDHISPDVYAALDVAPGLRPTWKTWEEGKFPDIVFEITSPSTEDVDRGSKLELYSRLGAREYYIYDPQQVMAPPLRAYARQGDALLPLALLPTGAVVSPLLGAELRPVGIYLRIIDPATGLPFRTADEERRGRIAEEQARIAAQGRADTEEQARLAVERRAEVAEERADAEKRTRIAEERTRIAVEKRAELAEERAARAEAALHEALTKLADRQPPTT